MYVYDWFLPVQSWTWLASLGIAARPSLEEELMATVSPVSLSVEPKASVEGHEDPTGVASRSIVISSGLLRATP